jgi:Site-specific recombinase XerD
MAAKNNKDIQLNHDVTLHGFRHTHGTLLLDNNSDLTFKDLQKRLGHKNLQTTINTYLHATNKSDDKMMEALKKVDDISNLSNKNEK